MKIVSFTEFRNNASSFLDLVEKGEEVDIQRHGKVVARLVPPCCAEGTGVEETWTEAGYQSSFPQQSGA